MITPCFEVVGGGNYAIDSLVVEGVDDGDASVQVVNADGSWGTMGVWLNEYVDGDTVYPAGWFTDASGAESANIALEPGQAVFFYTASEAAKAMSAGQVSGALTVSLSSGYSMIGNASPVAISIDEITLVGVDDGDASVQVVNADGSWGTMGVWLNEYVDGDTVYPAGWFTDASGAEAADITLQPGQSVFFYTTATGAKATIPSALAQ
ncbi:MAG: hypothetical protein J6S51_05515 [Kiritimatiellae bacterium]|nr:hypothetical protein [Kiritimatiellia bacterium]